jgi:hypothetical protein
MWAPRSMASTQALNVPSSRSSRGRSPSTWSGAA